MHGIKAGVFAALLMTSLTAIAPADTPEAAGRGMQVSLGAAGSFTDGDPLVGAYAGLRLPSAGPWALGMDTIGEYGQETVHGVTSEDYNLAALVAIDRELADVVAGPQQLRLHAGGRAGVAVERDETPNRTRAEPYPMVGVYGAAAWYVGPRVALESRLSVDVGNGTRLGLALGLRVGR